MESNDHRARVFLLTADNEWTDIATGHCHCTISSSQFTISIYPESEDPDPIFSCAIDKETEVSIQQDTVISWTRSDGSDIAVSFETQSGCENCWTDICSFQGRAKRDEDDENEAERIQQLPQVIHQSTLPAIEACLAQSSRIPFVKRSLAGYMVESLYVSKLLDLFEEAERGGDSDTLSLLFSCFRSMIFLNSPVLLKELLSAGNVYRVAGVFEYEPVSGDECPKYRQYLSDRSKFQQIFSLTSPHTLALIHETFWAQYFKDVILPRVLDDDTFTTLVMIIRSNHLEIINGLENEGEIYCQLDPFLKTDSIDLVLQILKFFKEFLNIARTCTSPNQLRLYQGESLSKFVGFLENILKRQDAVDRLSEAKVLAMELFLSICQHDPQVLRQIFVENGKSRPSPEQLMSTLIDCFLHESNQSGVRWQLVHLIKTIVDNSIALSSPSQSRVMDECLNQFYPHHATKLLQPIIDGKRIDDDTVYHLCELLTFFIQTHKYRIKYLLLRSFIVQNLLVIFSKHPLPWIKAAALRVFRTMIATNDDFYYRFFVKHSSFRPIIALFKQVDGRNNLIESALFELFEAIRAGQSRILINHLVEEWEPELRSLNNTVFDRLLDVYQRLNPINSPKPSNDDDEYFSRSDHEDDGTGVDGAHGDVYKDLHDLHGDTCGNHDSTLESIVEPRPYSPSKRSKLDEHSC